MQEGGGWWLEKGLEKKEEAGLCRDIIKELELFFFLIYYESLEGLSARTR